MTVSDLFRACRRADLARAIAMLQQAGQVAHVELFRAVYAGTIALVNASGRTEALDAHHLRRQSRPVLVVIGDDDEHPTGPDGWRCARAVTEWAGAAVVHGAGATPETYREAIRAATTTGRGLLVETNGAHVAAWAALLIGKPVLCIVPRGGVHPIAPARDGVH